MRNWKDLRTLFFLSLMSDVQIFLLRTDFGRIGAIDWLGLFLMAAVGSMICCVINHNHRHHPIFRRRVLNRLVNAWISVLIGAPSIRLHLVHHLNHHRHYPGPGDWAHYGHCATGEGLGRILTYLVRATRSMSAHRHELVTTKQQVQMLREERLAVYLFAALALWLNWKAFLFLILPTWFVGQALLLTSNLLNHDRCRLDDSVNSSRDFLSGFENWILFNNGYHAAHHLKAAVHWSELPQLHRDRVAPFKDSEFLESSFFWFLLKVAFRSRGAAA
jgi:fatty acid desaturase